MLLCLFSSTNCLKLAFILSISSALDKASEKYGLNVLFLPFQKSDISISDADPKELFPNGHRVKYFLDADLRNASRVSFHPCENTASVILSNDNFLRFLELWGGEIEWLDMN